MGTFNLPPPLCYIVSSLIPIGSLLHVVLSSIEPDNAPRPPSLAAHDEPPRFDPMPSHGDKYQIMTHAVYLKETLG